MADKKKYYIPIEGKMIEVEENVCISYYKVGSRERYLEERAHDRCVMSHDAMDCDGMR